MRIVLTSMLAVLIACLLVVPNGCEPAADSVHNPNPNRGSTKDDNVANKDNTGKDAIAKDRTLKDIARKDASGKDAPEKDGVAKDAARNDGKSTTSNQHPDKEYRVLQETADRLMVTLPNRMIVVAQEIKTAPVVSSQIWVKTGSIYEQEHVGAGLSHFLEHLLSGGTTSTRKEEESNAILGRIGARTNAFTSLGQVAYYINTTRPYAADAIDLMTDWMQNNLIGDVEFARERQVIQREFQMGQGEPNRILWKLMQQARFKVHPARHPTIGYLEVFLDITRDEIFDFYKRMYVPNNMVFVVTGDIDKQQVVDQITALWKDQPEGKLPNLSFPIEPEIEQPVTLSGVADIRRPRLRLAWPGTQLGKDGDYALDLLGVILGQGESSRLVQTVRDRDRLVTSVSAYNLSFTWGAGFFATEAELMVPAAGAGQPTDAAQDQAIQLAVQKTKASIIAEIERIKDKGVTQEELDRAKRQTVAQVIFSAQTAEDMADRLARDVIGMGDPDYLKRYAKAVQALTVDDIRDAAAKYLVDQKTITLTLFPSGGEKPLPLKKPDDSNLPKVESEPVDLDNRVLIQKIVANTAGDTGDASTAMVEDIKEFKLSNGLRLLVGRSTLIPAVSMQMYHAGGLLADEPGFEGIANATANMQVKGTTTRTAQDIAETIESLGASLSTQCGNNTHYAAASCLKEDWRQVMELFADVIINPTFPEKEWEKFQPRLIASIDRQMDRWDSELGLRFRQSYFKDHPWQTPRVGRKEVVGALRSENLADFHKKHLGASDAVLAVFGDVDPAMVFQEAEKRFASMPATAQTPVNLKAPTTVESNTFTYETSKQTTAVQIGFGPGVARDNPDYAAIQVMIRVLYNFPGGWLERALRGEGTGLSYVVWAYQVTGIVPGYVNVVFNCKVADLDEALARVEKVIIRMRNEEVDDDTLARAKAAVLTGEFLGKQSNADRAMEAALNELYGLPRNASDQFLDQVQAVNAKKLKEIANKYLVNPVTVVLKEKEAAPAPSN